MKRSRSVSSSIFSKRVAGVLDQDAVQAFLDLDELLGVDEDVLGRALGAGHGLMDHDPRVGQGLALSVAPAASSTAPIEAAWPTQYVATGQLTNCIVS